MSAQQQHQAPQAAPTFCVVQPYSGTRSWMRMIWTCGKRERAQGMLHSAPRAKMASSCHRSAAFAVCSRAVGAG